jgi:hypothetical protein
MMKNFTKESAVSQVSSGTPAEDGLRLCLNWFARHGDSEMAPAAANILARIDGGKKTGTDPMDISAPPHAVQQYVGEGQFLGVELKSGDHKDILAADPAKAVPQVGGVDPVGQLKPAAAAVPVAPVTPAATPVKG